MGKGRALVESPYHGMELTLFLILYSVFSSDLLGAGQLFRSRGNFAYEIFGHTLIKALHTP